MTNAFVTEEDYAAFVRRRRPSRGLAAPAATGAAALTASLMLGGWLLSTQPGLLSQTEPAPTPPPATVSASIQTAPVRTYGALLDPAILGLPPAPLGHVAPLQSAFEAPAPTPDATRVAAAAPPAAPMPLAVTIADAGPDEAPATPTPQVSSSLPETVPLPPVAITALQESVPLPLPRPAELRAQPVTPASRMASRPAPRQPRSVVAAAAPVDNRSFFEKIFGAPTQPAGPALAYAAPDSGFFHDQQRSAPSAVMPVPSDRSATAVYDISAHTVTLPDGTKLEAHSGLGSRLDDPRHVAERNVGPTPPSVYDLTPREQLFHGVAALRLTPVGGGHVYGRTGLLAHTFMLGPNGDSNGCVSFRDYNAFLQAYRRGAIKRLMVVARAD